MFIIIIIKVVREYHGERQSIVQIVHTKYKVRTLKKKLTIVMDTRGSMQINKYHLKTNVITEVTCLWSITLKIVIIK